MSGLSTITVCGNDISRGRMHGEICRQLIRDNIEYCSDLCFSNRGVSVEKLKEEAMLFRRSLIKYDDRLYQEIKGIAQGANAEVADILILNCRSELINKLWAVSMGAGCTTFAFRNGSGNLYIAQTWDWMKPSRKFLILLHSKNEYGNQNITLTEAGIIGNVGVNDKGISVFLNYVSVMDANPIGAPYHILLRRALDSKDNQDVLHNLIRSPIAFAIHIISADPSRKALSFELTSGGIDFLCFDEGYLAHTNHILSDRLVVRDFSSTIYDDSHARLTTVQRRLEKLHQQPVVDFQDIYAVFQEHNQNEYDLCKHSKGVTDFDLCTHFTIVSEYNNNGQYFHYSLGTPCQATLNTVDCMEAFWG